MEARFALELSERIVALGVMVGSLEGLARPQIWRDDGLLSWQVASLRDPFLARWRMLGFVFAPPGIYLVLSVRLLAAVVVLLLPSGQTLGLICLVIVTGLSLGLMLRSTYGNDGADQMQILVLLALTIARLTQVLEPALFFIAGQCLLSYLTSGIAKLGGRAWRDGSGMIGVLSTRTYGWTWLAGVLRARPKIALLLGWLVILTEVLFSLVLVVAPSWIPLFLIGGMLFHVVNAGVMGLNAFVWAFGAAYPAIWFVAQRL